MSNGGTPRDSTRPDQRPSGDTYHDDKGLIADLTSVNGQVSRYVLRYLDADAGRAVPISPDDELALGERMVRIGEAVQARAGKRGRRDS